MASSSSSSFLLALFAFLVLVANQALAITKERVDVPPEGAFGVDIHEGRVKYDEACHSHIDTAMLKPNNEHNKLVAKDFNIGLLEVTDLEVTYIKERTLRCDYYVFKENKHYFSEQVIHNPTVDDCKRSRGVLVPKSSTDCEFMAGHTEIQHYQVKVDGTARPRVAFDQVLKKLVLHVVNVTIPLELSSLDKLKGEKQITAGPWCIKYDLSLNGCKVTCQELTAEGFWKCKEYLLFKEVMKTEPLSSCSWTNLFQLVCDEDKYGADCDPVLDPVATSASLKLTSTETKRTRKDRMCEQCRRDNVLNAEDGLYCHDQHLYRVSYVDLDINEMIDAGNVLKIRNYLYDPKVAMFVNYHHVNEVERFQQIPKFILLNAKNGLFNCSITTTETVKLNTQCRLVQEAGEWIYTPAKGYLDHYYERSPIDAGKEIAKSWWQKTTSVFASLLSGAANFLRSFFSFKWLETTLIVLGTVACLYIGWKVYSLVPTFSKLGLSSKPAGSAIPQLASEAFNSINGGKPSPNAANGKQSLDDVNGD